MKYLTLFFVLLRIQNGQFLVVSNDRDSSPEFSPDSEDRLIAYDGQHDDLRTVESPEKRRGWGKRDIDSSESGRTTGEKFLKMLDVDEKSEEKRRGWGKRSSEMIEVPLPVSFLVDHASIGTEKRRGWGKRMFVVDKKGWGKRRNFLYDTNKDDKVQVIPVDYFEDEVNKRRGWGRRR